MSLIKDIRDLRLKMLVEHEREYQFPDFMRAIRKTLGLSRKEVIALVNVSESKLFYLEHGQVLDLDFSAALSHLYGVDCSLIINKLKAYKEKVQLIISG